MYLVNAFQQIKLQQNNHDFANSLFKCIFFNEIQYIHKFGIHIDSDCAQVH